MHIHWLQHVPFEGLGSIADWAEANGHTMQRVALYANDELPSVDEVQGVVVMGGPMGVHDHQQYPWLLPEQAFIQAVIAAGKPVLGICLGAQLIAMALGAQVSAGKTKEIGWWPVFSRQQASVSNAVVEWPTEQRVLHWHGDTFDCPDGAVSLAYSEVTAQQAFRYQQHVLALQFHLESTAESIQVLIGACRDELPYPDASQSISQVQTESQLKAGQRYIPACQAWLKALLDELFVIL